MASRLIPWMCLAIVACGEVVESSTHLECFDGLDNEGTADGQMDCADPTCAPYAACVETTASQAGVVVGADDPCPAGFGGGERVIHRGLQPGGCDGCGCDVGTTECLASIWTYLTDNLECSQDNGLVGGVKLGITVSTACVQPCTPIWGISPPNYGVRVDIEAKQGCTATGTATLAESKWMESAKFCAADRIGTGCGANRACVPRVAKPAEQCTLAQGATSCPGFGSSTTWHTGIDDKRTCGACLCQGVGGDCNGVELSLGVDYSCGGPTNQYNFDDNEKQCWGSTPYSPCAGLLGTPKAPTACTSSASPTGAIAPTGEQTLCCSPST